MHSYPQFFFWIPRALAEFCFLCVVLNRSKISLYLESNTWKGNPSISRCTLQNICAITIAHNVLNLISLTLEHNWLRALNKGVHVSPTTSENPLNSHSVSRLARGKRRGSFQLKYSMFLSVHCKKKKRTEIEPEFLKPYRKDTIR